MNDRMWHEYEVPPRLHRCKQAGPLTREFGDEGRWQRRCACGRYKFLGERRWRGKKNSPVYRTKEER